MAIEITAYEQQLGIFIKGLLFNDEPFGSVLTVSICDHIGVATQLNAVAHTNCVLISILKNKQMFPE
ncbi:hypothetical protein [Pseudoalteromonas distincta]|uniref:hypothetical protein n=1 Tax=Pseudoalteromonas distincta TaxID=77608 RepID=UPI0039ECE171